MHSLGGMRESRQEKMKRRGEGPVQTLPFLPFLPYNAYQFAVRLCVVCFSCLDVQCSSPSR